MKILFLAEASERKGLSPASRFRIYQYLIYLRKDGMKFKVAPSFPAKYFMSRPLLTRIDSFSGWLGKFIFYAGVFMMIFKRFYDVLRALRYDIVFIQREILPVHFPPFLERMFSKTNKIIIFDFDDAIYNVPTKYRKEKKGRLSAIFNDENIIPEIIKMSKMVIVANRHLYEYARKYHHHVIIIPTPVDTEKYSSLEKKESKIVTIGWLGTSSNLIYLYDLKDVFREIARRYDFILKIVCNTKDVDFQMKELNIKVEKWNIDSEIDELRSFDIGVMPLRDDEWTRGKSGFKALQYMAMEIPTIASPVGVNKEIIIDGVNGFLASSTQEWIDKLSLLIKNRELRKKLGAEGRKTVEEKYSLEINTSLLLECLKKVIDFKKLS